MIRIFLAVLLTLSGVARAQDSIVSTPLPPLQDQAPPPDAAPAPPDPPKPKWLPKKAALIQGLDKVNARARVLTIPNGSSATFGTLTIQAKNCSIRPPDMPADATAFLTVTEKGRDKPLFAGWMLKAEPSVSMLEHPVYDLRVVGCGD